ncbi:hypothetical protein QCA50_020001 [Cerrena zonata]|uniref:Uncharacterized protein n=1 Tax=Cerrena zonata TaxID=2478898 RepID=A0AAW0F9V6_9APHY
MPSGTDLFLGAQVGQMFGNNHMTSFSTAPTSAPTTPVHSKAHAPSSPASSDLGFSSYPETDSFMSALGETNPRCAQALKALGEALVEEDLFNINELQEFTKEKYIKDYGQSEGNAQFVVERVKREIKKIQKGKKQASNN